MQPRLASCWDYGWAETLQDSLGREKVVFSRRDGHFWSHNSTDEAQPATYSLVMMRTEAIGGLEMKI